MANVPKSRDTCPVNAGETAESYVMNRLSPADAIQFATHCLSCRRCAAAAEEAKWYVRAMKAAARQLQAEKPQSEKLQSGPHDQPLLCSRATYTSVTPQPRGGLRIRMRFDVTMR